MSFNGLSVRQLRTCTTVQDITNLLKTIYIEGELDFSHISAGLLAAQSASGDLQGLVNISRQLWTKLDSQTRLRSIRDDNLGRVAWTLSKLWETHGVDLAKDFLVELLEGAPLTRLRPKDFNHLALAAAGLKQPELTLSIAQHSRVHWPHMGGQALANLVWALGNMERQSTSLGKWPGKRELLSELANEILVRKNLKPRDLSQLLWGFTRLAMKKSPEPPSYFSLLNWEDLWKSVRLRLPEYAPQDFSNLYWSYAQAHLSGQISAESSLFKELEHRALVILRNLEVNEGINLGSIVFACGVSSYSMNPTKLELLSLAADMTSDFLQSSPEKLSSHSLSTIIWVLAKTQLLDSFRLHQTLGEDLGWIPRLNDKGRGLVAWSFGASQVSETCHHIMGPLIDQSLAGRTSDRTLGNLIWAAAKHGFLHEDLLDRAERLNTQGLPPQWLANFYWALNKLRPESTALLQIATLDTEVISMCQPQEISSLAMALGSGVARSDAEENQALRGAWLPEDGCPFDEFPPFKVDGPGNWKYGLGFDNLWFQVAYFIKIPGFPP